MNRWRPSDSCDPDGRELADRHYSRRRPGSVRFVRPAFCAVFLAGAAPSAALWVTVRQNFVDHAWPGAWECALFRNEGAGLSSELITEAVAATMGEWGAAPAGGFISFVAPECVPGTNPGYCFRVAGWDRLKERTKVHKRLVFHLPPDRFPEPFKVGQQRLYAGAAQ